MSTRRAPQSKQKKPGLENVGARVRQRALSGTEASTVGFVLVSYVFAGAGFGYLADKFLETNWIVAAGVLLGSALGFWEMFRMIKHISRIEAKASEKPNQQTDASQINASQINASQINASRESQVALKQEYFSPKDLADQGPEPIPKAPAFPIPAPPTPSFDNPDNKPQP